MEGSPNTHESQSKLLTTVLTSHRILLFLTGGCVAILMFSQVIMRYLLRMSVYGLEELAVFFAFWVYFVGLAYTSWDDYHISADLIPLIAKSNKVRRRFKLFSKGASIVVAGFMTYLAAIQVHWFFIKKAATVELGIPIWIIYALICYGFAASTFSFGKQFYDLLIPTGWRTPT